MFFCLLGEVVSYLFYKKWPTEVNRWRHLNHISSQGTKRRMEKVTPAKVFSLYFAEFSRTLFLETLAVAPSEDKHEENNLLHIASRLNKCYL